ncbi:uncharacterized protein LOC121381210 [Gigantopelta aegis]|uniref:uncharacterized protein LOC121381210 n=1 Tax=Gigantopelta aegis TaxID=1735272 RepID=UPI001B88BA88|nr:uncharacterized protein LOC121381210 [Gigantopelta aegis]
MAKCVTESLQRVTGLLLLFAALVYGIKPCRPGTYWDHGTNKCDPCSLICHMAERQGTLDECETKCPDYGRIGEQASPKQCKKDWYFDKHVAKCASCGVLCYKPNIQDTVDECNSKCPGFLTKELPDLEGQEVVEPEMLTHKEPAKMTPLDITIIIVVSGTIIVIAVVLVVKWLKRRRANNIDEKRPTQVVDNTMDSGQEHELLRYALVEV